MKRKTRRREEKRVKVPLVWLICSWACLILLGVCLFFFILKTYGVSFPIVAGQSTDPFFFAAVIGILFPLILQFFLIKILRGIVLKHSALEIAKEVGKDMAVSAVEVAAGTILDAVTGSDGTTGRLSSSSSGGTTGGGGDFGGGGASGGY